MRNLLKPMLPCLLSLLLSATVPSVCLAATLYVATSGSDANPGTQAQPVATIAAAVDAARQAGAGPNRIIVLPGDYYLEKPIWLNSRDSGLTIEAAVTNSVTVYGGKAVTGWRRDGMKFWCADLPGVKEGTWDFRSLVVNGRMPERARMPESGTFMHKSVFDVKYLSSVGGGFERKPTQEELTTMLYNPTDLPATLDTRNAEVRVYHMWDESLVGVASNDVKRHALTFTPPANKPPGAYGIKKYVVFNTREGMTKPGQWYLDRTAGRVVYWPLQGEDMGKAKAVAPMLERVIHLMGTAEVPAERITLRGFSVQATTTPLNPCGFSAQGFDGALALANLRQCAVENLEICNVGGQAIQSSGLDECRIEGCHVHHTGACGLRISGTATSVVSNHIHHVGVTFLAGTALHATHWYSEANPEGIHLYRNEIHDVPNSGIILVGGGHLVEENIISRAMLEMHDGGAIYGAVNKTVLRGNVARDVVKIGPGFGVYAYGLDEGSKDCVVERNVSIGVERPVSSYMASDVIIRDNVFSVDADMTLMFRLSRRCSFTGNKLYTTGKITVSPPNAITTWASNVVVHGTLGGKGGVPRALPLGDASPPAPKRRSFAFSVARLSHPPALDGEFGKDEWPGSPQGLDREPSRWGHERRERVREARV